MKKSNVPPVKILLESESYNTLLTVLDELSGEYYPENLRESASKFSAQIQNYGRLIRDKSQGGGASIRVCFFENEAADLITLLILSLLPYTIETYDFFQRKLFNFPTKTNEKKEKI
ncbi:MAG: hypothetical protein LBU36_00410 [Clostridiales bacterium]|jgi:hypothetical protein|nr:hypothetical protein [Clostridiales bacterium]